MSLTNWMLSRKNVVFVAGGSTFHEKPAVRPSAKVLYSTPTSEISYCFHSGVSVMATSCAPPAATVIFSPPTAPRARKTTALAPSARQIGGYVHCASHFKLHDTKE